MANQSKTLRTRIQSKFDHISAWNANGGFIPLEGEIVIAYVPGTPADLNPDSISLSAHNLSAPPTQFLMKVGDGHTAISALEWLTAKAGDIYNWAKTENLEWDNINTEHFLSGLESYIEDHSQNADYQLSIGPANITTPPGWEGSYGSTISLQKTENGVTTTVGTTKIPLAWMPDIRGNNVDSSTGIKSYSFKGLYYDPATGNISSTASAPMLTDRIQLSAIPATTSAYIKSYQLMRDGTPISGSVIDIPKDFLLSTATAQYVSSYNPVPAEIADLPGSEKVIDFTINTIAGDTSHIYVPVRDLLGDSLDATVSADADEGSGNYFNVLSGATVTQDDALLTSMSGRSARLNKIALEGNANYLTQEEGDFLVLNCGSATQLTSDPIFF